jgi:hypothetical protein
LKGIDASSGPRRPLPFKVGLHEVSAWQDHGRWFIAVDGAAMPTWFRTLADAWTAGVTEADRLDRGGT